MEPDLAFSEDRRCRNLWDKLIAPLLTFRGRHTLAVVSALRLLLGPSGRSSANEVQGVQVQI